MQTDTRTRGELLVEGLATIRDGLQMIGQAGGGHEQLVRLLATNRDGARQLRELMRGPGLLHQVVMGMVRARNGRLSVETVDKVVTDFLAVLQDLAQPLPPAEGEGANIRDT